jgi:hypothetical protein
VVVNTLADFFRTRIERCGALLQGEEQGPEHTVLVYGNGATAGIPAEGPPGNQAGGPVYPRHKARYEMEGIGYEIGAVHGAAEFDRPGEGAAAAAKLLRRLGAGNLFEGNRIKGAPVLIHEGGQGHFPLWFLRFLEQGGAAAPERLILHGRNILALEAAQDNILAGGPAPDLRILPGADLLLDRDRIFAALGAEHREKTPGRCGCAAVFPQAVPQTSRRESLWESLGDLLIPGGLALLALPAAEADRFDKRKPPGFTRLGNLKHRAAGQASGFRAMAYRREGG